MKSLPGRIADRVIEDVIYPTAAGRGLKITLHFPASLLAPLAQHRISGSTGLADCDGQFTAISGASTQRIGTEESAT